jgi:hypothetical protein
LRVAEATRLVGSTFQGQSGLTPSTGVTNTDPNFWTGTCANSATINQLNNSVLISSGTNVGGSAIFQSVRIARYVGSVSNRFRAQIQLGDTGVADNTRRWGMFNGTDGAYFELAGTTLSACVRKTNNRTAVAALSAPTTSVTAYEIYITNSKAYFVIGGVLVATHNATSTTWSDALSLPVRIDNINSGSSTNSTITVRVATITRLGKLETNPQFKNITGVTTTQILKYGAGVLHEIIVGTVANSATIAVYDNVTGTTTPIILLSLPEIAAPIAIPIHAPFQNGLNIVPSSATLNLTVIYE